MLCPVPLLSSNPMKVGTVAVPALRVSGLFAHPRDAIPITLRHAATCC